MLRSTTVRRCRGERGVRERKPLRMPSVSRTETRFFSRGDTYAVHERDPSRDAFRRFFRQPVTVSTTAPTQLCGLFRIERKRAANRAEASRSNMARPDLAASKFSRNKAKGSPYLSAVRGQPSQTIAPIFRKAFLWEGDPPGRETTKEPRPVGFILPRQSAPTPASPASLKFFERSPCELCRNQAVDQQETFVQRSSVAETLRYDLQERDLLSIARAEPTGNHDRLLAARGRAAFVERTAAQADSTKAENRRHGAVSKSAQLSSFFHDFGDVFRRVPKPGLQNARRSHLRHRGLPLPSLPPPLE